MSDGLLYTPEKETETISQCTFVKTILMFLIVFYHCCAFWSKGSWFTKDPVFSSSFVELLCSWLNSFHIYSFAFVSGYIFYFLNEEMHHYNSFRTFLMKKVKRLIIPYYFIAVVWAFPIQMLFTDTQLSDLLPQYIIGLNPNQLWFLLMLFWVYILFFFLSGFFRKHTYAGVFTIAVFYSFGMMKQVLPNVFQIFTAFSYMPFFWIGFKIRQVGKLKKAIINKRTFVILLTIDLLLFPFVYYADARGITIKIIAFCTAFFVEVVGALMAFSFLQLLAFRTTWKESPLFNLFSSRSMMIYLFHQQLIYIPLFFLNGRIPICFHIIVNLTFSLCVSLLLCSVILRFKTLRFLVGE